MRNIAKCFWNMDTRGDNYKDYLKLDVNYNHKYWIKKQVKFTELVYRKHKVVSSEYDIV